MKIKIRGEGNTPSTGGWKVTDENDVDIPVERVQIDANSEKAEIAIKLFDAHDIEIEGEAEAVCEHSAQFAVLVGDKKIGLCSAHMGAARYLMDKGVYGAFDVIQPLEGCPIWKCGAQVL